MTDAVVECGHHPVVYVQGCCCKRQAPPVDPLVRSFADLPPPVVQPERNGHGVYPAAVGKVVRPGAETQPLPIIGKREESAKPRRHREEDDDGGLDVKDLALGALVGAGGAIFMVGLLMVVLFR